MIAMPGRRAVAGPTPAIAGENVRTLMGGGAGEADAIRAAYDPSAGRGFVPRARPMPNRMPLPARGAMPGVPGAIVAPPAAPVIAQPAVQPGRVKLPGGFVIGQRGGNAGINPPGVGVGPGGGAPPLGLKDWGSEGPGGLDGRAEERRAAAERGEPMFASLEGELMKRQALGQGAPFQPELIRQPGAPVSGTGRIVARIPPHGMPQ